MAIYNGIRIESFDIPWPKDCQDWPLGRCKRGADCLDIHEEMLDPEAVEARPHDYMVPNHVGVACLRCLQLFRECDKLGCGGADDPCSECRWFGGVNCDCQLALNTSYNDEVWKCMMQRSEQDFQLPASRPRDEAKSWRKKEPRPISEDRIKADWVGQSREELLAKTDDYLPDYVRAHPRAYVVPPRPTRARKTIQEPTRKAVDNDLALQKVESADVGSDQYESSNESSSLGLSPDTTPICRRCKDRNTR